MAFYDWRERGGMARGAISVVLDLGVP
jgi:hypothetical protein